MKIDTGGRTPEQQEKLTFFQRMPQEIYINFTISVFFSSSLLRRKAKVYMFPLLRNENGYGGSNTV